MSILAQIVVDFIVGFSITMIIGIPLGRHLRKRRLEMEAEYDRAIERLRKQNRIG